MSLSKQAVSYHGMGTSLSSRGQFVFSLNFTIIHRLDCLVSTLISVVERIV